MFVCTQETIPPLGTKPQINFLGYRHRPVADIRMPAAEGGRNKCVHIFEAIKLKAQPTEVDLGLRVG